MAFDLNEHGAIVLTPLVEYTIAAIPGVGCVLRLVLARPEDPLGTGSLVVQTTISDERSRELLRDLQRTIDAVSAGAPDRLN